MEQARQRFSTCRYTTRAFRAVPALQNLLFLEALVCEALVGQRLRATRLDRPVPRDPLEPRAERVIRAGTRTPKSYSLVALHQTGD
jgi:hypothetical protein